MMNVEPILPLLLFREIHITRIWLKLKAQIMFLEAEFADKLNDTVMHADGIFLTHSADMTAREILWRSAERKYHTTFFQSFDWCKAHLQQSGATPHIIVGTKLDGSFAFLLPFQLQSNTLQFLGQPENLYGYGIFSDWALQAKGLAWFEQHWPLLLRFGHDAQVIGLRDMPDRLHGAANPLLPLANFNDANTCTILNLTNDFDALLASRRGSEARSKMRNRDKRIADQGEIKFDALAGSPQAHEALDELLMDQAERLAESGISDPVHENYRTLLHAMLDQAGEPLRVLRLSVGGKTLASLLMAYHGDTVVFLMISLPHSPLRKYSPGDLALRRAIAHSISLGLKYFDFSRGAAAYKEHWKDDELTLHHCIRSNTLAGLPKSALMGAKASTMRYAKENAWLREPLYAVRRYLKGKSIE